MKIIILILFSFLIAIKSIKVKKANQIQAKNISEQVLINNSIKKQISQAITNDPTVLFAKPEPQVYSEIKSNNSYSINSTPNNSIINHTNSHPYYDPVIPAERIISLPGKPTSTIYTRNISEFFPNDENLTNLKIKYELEKANLKNDITSSAYYDPTIEVKQARVEDLKLKIIQMQKQIEENKLAEPKSIKKAHSNSAQGYYPIGYKLTEQEIANGLNNNILVESE